MASITLFLEDLYQSGSLNAKVDDQNRILVIHTHGAVSLSKKQATTLLRFVENAITRIQEGTKSGDEDNGWDPLCRSFDEHGVESVYVHAGAEMYQDDAREFARDLKTVLATM